MDANSAIAVPDEQPRFVAVAGKPYGRGGGSPHEAVDERSVGAAVIAIFGEIVMRPLDASDGEAVERPAAVGRLGAVAPVAHGDIVDGQTNVLFLARQQLIEARDAISGKQVAQRAAAASLVQQLARPACV